MKVMNDERQDTSAVQVALRIRPLIESEVSRGCQDILEVFPHLRQIRIKNTDKAFTFNYVCDGRTPQDSFYNLCISHMISNLFKGYNVTILAYGQTGSGKTHTMGTAYNGNGEMGIIPRAVHDIFTYVHDNFSYDFGITVSFMELYQETLYDLLAQKPRDECIVEMREDAKGVIIIPGLTEQPVISATQTLDLLEKGSQGRATASTNMNAQSSRSHAVFTINICIQHKTNSHLHKTAKFHLVDLAGSERSKKTGATGITFKEGVNINKGLLALGNVISALGDDKQQGYISYRDSHLTRLLKDSLGGNSITLMIACVSPADYNVDETVSTLRYADRAKRIKNKPIVNEDPKAAEINRLNRIIQQLRLELGGQGGPVISQAEVETLKREGMTLLSKNRELTIQLSATLNENAALFERCMLLESANESMHKKLLELKTEFNITLSNLSIHIEHNDADAVKVHLDKLHSIENIFNNIDIENKKAEEEILKHQCNQVTVTMNPDLNNETELSDKQASHTEQQIALNKQLQEVTKMLAMKEHLAQQMQTNNHYMVDYQAVTENEQKIATLEKEKEELLSLLKNVQIQGAGNKLAEQRRKRVQELEKEIHDLHKKLSGQSRLIKLKEKDQEKIKQLNVEIQQMKGIKVKLIKTMKQESDKFRVWKQQRERELSKLKEQDRKRQNQIIKMETIHSRQQNVLKRKVEEAAAINKRLKDALALRKTVQEQKSSGKVERLGPWVQHELDVFVNTVAAKSTLTGLVEDRASNTMRLQKLKANLEEADPLAIKQLEEEIEAQSTQIQQLQQKLLDSDEEDKVKCRWDNIQTMAESKFCLKTLFDLTAEIVRKEANNDCRLNDLQNALEETNQKLQQQTDQIEYQQAISAQELSNLAKDYEDKISVLLRQLRGITVEGIEDDFKNRYSIQQKALEQAEETIELLQKEKSELTKTLEDIRARPPPETPLAHGETPRAHAETPPAHAETPPAHKKAVYQYLPMITHPLDNQFDSSFEDDRNLDPDWRKTPLAKRIQKMRNTSMPPPPVVGDRLTIKRSADGSCTCKGNCSKRSCGCKKLGRSCGILCRCKIEMCLNRQEKENDSEEPDQQSFGEEDSFKKLRSEDDNTANESIKPPYRLSRRKRTVLVMRD